MQGSNFSRRKFISTSLGGLAAVGLAAMKPGISLADDVSNDKSKNGGALIHRKLGRTDITLPIISMGVMNSNNPEIVQASYELGVRHFATAASYQMGRNEQMLGRVIKQMGVRDKVIIATNIFAAQQRQNLTPAESKEKFLQLFQGSLRRMKTDFVDILNIHSVTSAADVQNEGAKEAMALLKKQGKVRAVGVTTHQNMTEVINEAVREGFFDLVTTSFNVSMADDTELLGAIKNAAGNGVGIVAMKTQSGGQQLPNTEARSKYNSSTMNTAALKWVIRNENITTAIPGYANFEHMKEDFSVAGNIEYTAEERSFLTENDLKLTLGFCRQCSACVASCPRSVDVPSLMRTHMYAAQYANFHQARATLDEITRSRGLQACVSCTGCEARCAHTVDIGRRIDDLKLMYA